MINVLRLLMNRSMAIALLFCGLFIIQGTKAYQILRDKANAQNTIIQAIQNWKNDYHALASSSKIWEKNYQVEDSVQDLVSLIPILGLDRYDLRYDTDKLILNKVEPITHNMVAIGLMKVCLTTDSQGFEVQAANYQTLFTGLKKIAYRPDISVSEIVIRGDKALPTAFLSDFCILLRKR